MTENAKPITSNAEKFRTTTRDGRSYSWGDESFYSVTSQLSALGKPWLGAWAAKMVAEYAVEYREEWTTLPKAGAIRLLKGAPWEKRDAAGNLGTAVHDAIEAAVLGQSRPEYPENVAPRMAHFDRFVEDFRPKWLASEAAVFSRKYRYAGTLDAIVEIGDETLLLDVKTSKDVYPEYALQLAAYRHAEFLGLADGSEAEIPATDGAAVLHITPDDYRLIRVRADEEIFRYFLYVSQCFRWMRETSKTAILDAVPVPAENVVERIKDEFDGEEI